MNHEKHIPVTRNQCQPDSNATLVIVAMGLIPWLIIALLWAGLDIASDANATCGADSYCKAQMLGGG